MNNLKKVAIVGRANVGKSTLFNRLSSNVKALTLDLAGVTRDFIKDVVTWKNSTFELIDSGGLILRKTQDELEKKVRDIGLAIIDEAEVVIFVVDGTIGVLPEDKQIAKILHQMKKNVLLAVNKIDTKLAQEQQYEFAQLGFNNVVNVSAQHNINVDEVLDFIVSNIGLTSKAKDEENVKYRITLLGKPNVGKSSLLNLLIEQERSIVSDVPGTTREAISERIKFYKESIQITDTAGVRRKRSVQEDIEELMVKSTLHAVRESDIILLLIDESIGQISDQELKLAFYVFEQGKALILLFNKEDLTTSLTKENLKFSLSDYKYFLKKLDSLNISCKTGKNVGKIITLVDKIWQRFNIEISDIELTELFKNALEKTPLFHARMPLMLFSAKQVNKAPLTIQLTVNESKWFGQSQLSFFENILRSKYDLKSVPVLFTLKKRRE